VIHKSDGVISGQSLGVTAIGQRGGLTELAWRLMKPFMMSPERGAETSLFLATVGDVGEVGDFPLHLLPHPFSFMFLLLFTWIAK
jgi:hypothetical protein